jgi:hypothetical protein
MQYHKIDFFFNFIASFVFLFNKQPELVNIFRRKEVN